MFEKKNWLAALAASIALMSVLICVGCKNSVDGDVGVGARSGDSNQLPLPEVGDLILKNGSVIPAAEINVSHKDEAMAIVYWVDVSNRKFMGMGLTIGEGLKWSDEGNLYYYDKDNPSLHDQFGDRLCFGNERNIGIDANLYPVWQEFGEEWERSVGNNSGKENDWGVKEKYPAFEYAREYGTTENFSGEFLDGWFLPTTNSLREIAKNIGKIKEAFNKIEKPELILENKLYWSSLTSTRGAPNKQYAPTLRYGEIYTDITKNSRTSHTERYDSVTVDVIAVRVFQY